MQGFYGSYSRSLDAKGRVMLPSGWRDFLVSRHMREADAGDAPDPKIGFWLTSFYGRLVAYMPHDWSVIVESLTSIRFPSRKLSNFKTKVLGLGQFVEPDAQGRMRIPQSLIREAGLAGPVMLVGMLAKFEIWDEAKFDAIEIEDVSDELSQQDIEISL